MLVVNAPQKQDQGQVLTSLEANEIYRQKNNGAFFVEFYLTECSHLQLRQVDKVPKNLAW